MQTVWTPNRPWGHMALKDTDGKMYRPLKKAESRYDRVIDTQGGPVRLRRMNRKEVRSLEVPVIRKKVRR